MDRELRRRLDAMPDEELLDILRTRGQDEWRTEVFSLVEDILRDRGIDPEARLERDEPQDVGGEPQVVAAANLDTQEEADLVRAALESAGIAVVPSRGTELVVNASDADDARAIVLDLQSGGAALPLESAADGEDPVSPADEAEPDPGPDPSVTVVARLETGAEADLVRAALESAGIAVRPSGGIDVVVDTEDADDARTIVRDLQSGEAALPAESCPDCGASGARRFRMVVPHIVPHTDLMGRSVAPERFWAWRCEACTHEWR